MYSIPYTGIQYESDPRSACGPKSKYCTVLDL